MPSQEYMFEDNTYDESYNGFTKVQRKRKNKLSPLESDEEVHRKTTTLFVGKDEFNNDKYIFGSNGQGSYIYSATAGYRNIHKVGSSDENLYFSVVDSRAYDKCKEPLTFYFNSPEQFERVMNVKVKNKSAWHQKFFNAKNRIINEQLKKLE